MVTDWELMKSISDTTEFEAVLSQETLLDLNEAEAWLTGTYTTSDSVMESWHSCSSSGTASPLTIGGPMPDLCLQPEPRLVDWEAGSPYSFAAYQRQFTPDKLAIADVTADSNWWGTQHDAIFTSPLPALDSKTSSPQPWPSPFADGTPSTSTPHESVSVSQSTASSPVEPPAFTGPRKTRGKKEATVGDPEVGMSRHRRIEKKYRNRITSGLDRLRASVPSLWNDEEEEPHKGKLRRKSTTTSKRKSKTTIICKAAEYIEQLEKRCEAAQQRADSVEREICRLRREYGSLRLGIFRFDMEGLRGIQALQDEIVACGGNSEVGLPKDEDILSLELDG